MSDETCEKLEAAVAKMADNVKATVDSTKALHFSQSALNLAQAMCTISSRKSKCCDPQPEKQEAPATVVAAQRKA